MQSEFQYSRSHDRDSERLLTVLTRSFTKHGLLLDSIAPGRALLSSFFLPYSRRGRRFSIASTITLSADSERVSLVADFTVANKIIRILIAIAALAVVASIGTIGIAPELFRADGNWLFLVVPAVLAPLVPWRAVVLRRRFEKRLQAIVDSSVST